MEFQRTSKSILEVYLKKFIQWVRMRIYHTNPGFTSSVITWKELGVFLVAAAFIFAGCMNYDNPLRFLMIIPAFAPIPVVAFTVIRGKAAGDLNPANECEDDRIPLASKLLLALALGILISGLVASVLTAAR